MKNVPKYLIISLVIIVFAISFYVWTRNRADLKAKHVYSTATITGWTPSSKSGLVLDYEFRVDGKTFQGSTKNFELKSDRAQSIIGEHFGLVYFPSNPDNNELLITQKDFASYNLIQPDTLTTFNHLFD